MLPETVSSIIWQNYLQTEGSEVRGLFAVIAVIPFLDCLDDGRLRELLCEHQFEED